MTPDALQSQNVLMLGVAASAAYSTDNQDQIITDKLMPVFAVRTRRSLHDIFPMTERRQVGRAAADRSIAAMVKLTPLRDAPYFQLVGKAMSIPVANRLRVKVSVPGSRFSSSPYPAAPELRSRPVLVNSLPKSLDNGSASHSVINLSTEQG